MTDHTITVNKHNRHPQRRCLQIRDQTTTGNEGHGVRKFVYPGDTVRWTSLSDRLDIVFSNGSPFATNPVWDPVLKQTQRVPVSATANDRYKYEVILTDGGNQISEDPQVIIDGTLNTGIATTIGRVFVLTVGASLVAWAVAQLFTKEEE